jgi:hypothetical protein
MAKKSRSKVWLFQIFLLPYITLKGTIVINNLKFTIMSKNIMISADNKKYINAFIEVAKVLEPNVEFDNVAFSKCAHEGGVDVDVNVSGYKNGCVVMVSKEVDDNKGEQIVVTYMDLESGKVIKKRKMWAYTFNWVGLMNTQP